MSSTAMVELSLSGDGLHTGGQVVISAGSWSLSAYFVGAN